MHKLPSLTHCGQNHDQQLTYEEFKEGAKRDPSIMQALSLYDSLT